MPDTMHSLIRYIRVAVGSWREDPRDDSELLSRFAKTRDETAFATLLWRHGAMVWRVCKHILSNRQDAEDAFQTVFLALARKAGQSSVKNPVGWLHKVAQRTALNTRTAAGRRKDLKHQSLDPEQLKLEDIDRVEQYTVLDEELARLPEKFRVPLILRYLEGKTQDEVARSLGCSRAVARKRLEKGEAVLREKMERRGLSTDVGAIVALLGRNDGFPAVPGCLVESTTRAAVAFRAGILNGAPAEAAERLLHSLAVKGAVRTGWWLVVACVCSLGLLGTGLAIWKGISLRSDEVMGGFAKTSDTLPLASTDHSSQINESHKPRLDIYGDPLPEGAIARLGTTRWRITGRHISAPIFTTDGKTVIQGDRGCLWMWEFPGGRLLRCLGSRENSIIAEKDVILANAISADGKLLAIGMWGGDIELWDLNEGKPVGHLDDHTKKIPVRALVFLPDSKTLCSGMEDNSVRFWSVATKKEVRRIDLSSLSKKPIRVMALSPNGRVGAASNAEGIIRLWDLESGRCIGEMSGSEHKYGGFNIDLAFSANGQKLASTGDDNLVTLWDTATCKSLLQLKLDYQRDERSIKLSPDGKVLATCNRGNDEVHLWDACTGKILHTLPNCSREMLHMSFSPDSNALVTGGMVQTLKLWDVATGKSLSRQEGHEWAVDVMTFSPDGKNLASMSQSNFYDTDSAILMWNVASCKLRQGQVERQREKMPGRCYEGKFLSYSPDGKVLASTSEIEKDKKTVLFWDVATGKQLYALKGLKDFKGVAAFAPDSKELAIATEKTVEICNAASGKLLHSLEVSFDLKSPNNGRDEIAAVVFSPDRKRLASIHMNGIAIWDVATGVQLSSLVIPKDGSSQRPSVSSVAFSADGKMLVSGGNTDKTIRLWEIATSQERLKIPLERGGVKVSFSPDDRLLASAVAGSTEEERAQGVIVQLWDPITGRQLHQFPPTQERIDDIGGNCVRPLAFAPDGRTLASGNEDTTVLIWDLMPWVSKVAHQVILSPGELQTSWSALSDSDACKAYKAIGKLVATSDQAVRLLADQLLCPVAVDVRQRITRLLADLDSDNFEIRQKSREDLQKELQKSGDKAELILRQALKNSPSPESRRSLEELLGKRNDENGISLMWIQRLRGLEVLERIGTPAARQVIQELAKTSVEIREEAQAALSRVSATGRTERP